MNVTDPEWIDIDVDWQLVCFDPSIRTQLVIVYAKSGSYDSPQNAIVAVALRLQSSGRSICRTVTCTLMWTTAVTFVERSGPTATALPTPPRWRVRIPRDFFYPFLLTSSSSCVPLSLLSHWVYTLAAVLTQIQLQHL